MRSPSAPRRGHPSAPSWALWRPSTDLGTCAIRAVLEDSGIDPARIDEVLMGCVLPAGLGQAPARRAASRHRVPLTMPVLSTRIDPDSAGFAENASHLRGLVADLNERLAKALCGNRALDVSLVYSDPEMARGHRAATAAGEAFRRVELAAKGLTRTGRYRRFCAMTARPD